MTNLPRAYGHSPDSYLNCEIAGDAAGDVQSLTSLKDGSADLIVTYYVFEHVVGLPDMLAQCRRVLADDGVLVIEVPDIGYYPHMLDAIALHEHVNHFSVRSLRALLARAGFRMTSLSREHASRKFGFVAAFEKGAETVETDASEVQDATASLQAGHALMRAVKEREERLRKQILDWSCGRAACRGLGRQCLVGGCDRRRQNPWESSWCVDSNPKKSKFLFGPRSFLPEARASDLKAADVLAHFYGHLGQGHPQAGQTTSRRIGRPRSFRREQRDAGRVCPDQQDALAFRISRRPWLRLTFDAMRKIRKNSSSINVMPGRPLDICADVMRKSQKSTQQRAAFSMPVPRGPE